MSKARRRRRMVAVAMALWGLAACAGAPRSRGGQPLPLGFEVAPARAIAPAPNAPAPPAPGPRSGGNLGGAWIPWAKLDLNERPYDESSPQARIDEGTGWAARSGFVQDEIGTDVVFSTTSHDELRTGAELTTYALYIDFTQTQDLWTGPVSAWIGGGLGLGVIRFDWDSVYRSETSGLWQAEGCLGLVIGRRVSIEARAQGFIAGYPTRTSGFGATAMLGGSILF